MFRHLKKLDWTLACSIFFLSFIGLISIYSSSAGEGSFLNFKKQLFFLSASFLLMFFISFFDWRTIKENSYFILFFYFICLFAIIGLFFIGSKTRGIVGWYKLSFFSFDPIEPTKIILIILLAKYFSMRHVEMYRLSHIIVSGLYVLAPAFLIVAQPNLGSALILVAIWFGVLIISGIKLRHFILLILAGVLIFSASWPFVLKDYQKQRIISFLTPQLDPLGSGWNQTQSKIAVGSGGIFGQGFLKGSQTQYGFLPEAQTDFIFAAIAEEFGLIGVFVIFILFIILIWRIIKIAVNSGFNFPRIFAAGFIVVLMSQILIHIGMNLGIFPVIGISLPFVSYGGSGLLFMYMGIGILQSIKTH